MDGGMLVGVEDRLPGWIEHMKARGLSDASISTYAGALKQFLTYCKYKRHAAEETDWQFLERWIRHLLDAKQKPGTINCKLQAVGSYFDYLMRVGVILANPKRDIRILKRERKIPKFFSEEMAAKIIAAAETPRNRAILTTLYCCGLRRAELIGINLEDVLWPQAIIRIKGKGKRQRIVPIPAPCLDALQQYLPERKTMMEQHKRGRDPALFLRYSDGTRVERNAIYLLVQEAAKVAGYEGDAHPHLFRHSYATHMFNRGADLRTLQELLGHEHLSSTEMYTHVAVKKLTDTVTQYHPLSLTTNEIKHRLPTSGNDRSPG